MRLHLVVLARVLTASCGSVAAAPRDAAAVALGAGGDGRGAVGADRQTMTAHVGDRIQIALGEQYKWQLEPPDGVVLTRTVQNSALALGTQAIWLASATGRSPIKATGTAVCPSAQPCPRFAILFTAAIVVAP